MPLPEEFLEIDFLAVESAKSGDAIAIRYNINNFPYIHVVDGGFSEMGPKIESHIAEYYTNQSYIDHVVLTHPDQDHASGLRYVLENMDVRALWMHRPWLYADELINRFRNYTNVDNLAKALRDAYPLIVELEEIAVRKGIPILEVFQGASIGAFRVLSPSKEFFLQKVVESTRTPAPAADDFSAILKKALLEVARMTRAAVSFVTAGWGDEKLSNEPTSAENEMSVVQYANFGGKIFLLTGDAGREALQEVVNFAPYAGLALPGINTFQVPHHGSRRNVSSDLLDSLVGGKLSAPVGSGNELFSAIVSSALEDTHHPKKAVERALHHRGAKVLATEGVSIVTGWKRPDRGWGPLPSRAYPTEQEA
jgi:beta-lactamase superfamily II metal-dependent hydrolase